MDALLKYDGFLPKSDGDKASTLYRVNLSSEVGVSNPQCIALLVDTSGSMEDEMGNLTKAIISTVDTILARKIASLDEIVLIQFHSDARVHSGFLSYDFFKQVVMGLVSDGGTSYCYAIDELTKLLQTKQNVIAVMFSDGSPTDSQYPNSIENLKTVAGTESLLFHSIGLSVDPSAEEILRSLTFIGSTEGYYQSIDGSEIVDSMNVLVDHFNWRPEPTLNGKRTRNGFVVDVETQQLVATLGDQEISLEVVDESFQEMLEKNSFESILDAIRFLLEYYLRNESLTFDQVIPVLANVSSLLQDTESKFKALQKEKKIELAEEKKAKLNSIEGAGASYLKQRCEIISECNKQVQSALNEDTALSTKIHELKELSAQIQETLHKNRNISASLSGEIMNAVNQFRDNSIATSRKHIARFSSKVREGNEKFQNIDKLLQDELDRLVQNESIPVPTYFKDYSDPITLNDFQDIMLHKFGVFMLLANIKRHTYGIAAPHKTKIVQIGGFSSCVLDVMMNNHDKSILFDFRGIGFGNAAVPLWISPLHWEKAKHVFGPFVGHAVTGNELEYTKLQGMTLLALILIHLRGLEATEFNRELIRMVGETLRVVLDKKKWQTIADEVSNSFENLNEDKIPSVEVFLFFQEFMGKELPRDKALLLLAEQYRRKNAKRIEAAFSKLKFSPEDRCFLLTRVFPTIYQRYLNIASGEISVSLNKKSMENYFTPLYTGKKDSKALKWFNEFSEKLSPSLKKLASSLDNKQKIAIVLSVHKCVCFKWEALDEIPAGLSYDGEYPDLILAKVQKLQAEKAGELKGKSNEEVLFRILQTTDKTEAETLLRGIPRNSHEWAVMMKVLLLSNKIKRPPKLTVPEWEKHRTRLFKEQIRSLAVPLHFELLMFCVFDSFKAEDWISTKMVWRPNLLLRRRIRAMFPDAPAIE